MATNALSNLRKITRELSGLSDPLRLCILLIMKNKKRPVTWSELKGDVERFLGMKINPNVLSFHLRRLIETGLVIKQNTREPKYVINTNAFKRLLSPLIASNDILLSINKAISQIIGE